MFILIFVVLFIIQSVLTYGLIFAHVQNKYKTIAKEQYLDDMASSMLFGAMYSLLPVVGFLIALLMTEFGRFGFKFK